MFCSLEITIIVAEKASAGRKFLVIITAIKVSSEGAYFVPWSFVIRATILTLSSG